jgi:hypothetical protein
MPSNRNGLLGNKIPKFFDLVEIPSNALFENFVIGCGVKNQYSFFETCVSLDGQEPPKEFLDGRNFTLINNNIDYSFKDTLGYKQIIFWMNDRSAKYNLFNLSQTTFKSCYTELANRISGKLGDYAAIHVRRTDYPNKANNKEVQKYLGTQEQFKTKILLTDEPTSMKWLTNYILIDDLIYEHCDYFKNLEYSDETVFGLISMLVAQKAKHFIGTVGSTYSGIIASKVKTAIWMNDAKRVKKDSIYEWNTHSISLDSKLWYKPWNV